MPDEQEFATSLTPSRGAASFGDRSGVPALRGTLAATPRAPELPAALKRAELERHDRRQDRERIERRSMLRGLLLLALVVLLVSLLRAGMGRAFPAGWWR